MTRWLSRGKRNPFTPPSAKVSRDVLIHYQIKRQRFVEVFQLRTTFSQMCISGGSIAFQLSPKLPKLFLIRSRIITIASVCYAWIAGVPKRDILAVTMILPGTANLTLTCPFIWSTLPLFRLSGLRLLLKRRHRGCRWEDGQVRFMRQTQWRRIRVQKSRYPRPPWRYSSRSSSNSR